MYRVLWCNSSPTTYYIGETKQLIKKRYYLQTYNTKVKNANYSGVVEHSISFTYKFDFHHNCIQYCKILFNNLLVVPEIMCNLKLIFEKLHQNFKIKLNFLRQYFPILVPSHNINFYVICAVILVILLLFVCWLCQKNYYFNVL